MELSPPDPPDPGEPPDAQQLTPTPRRQRSKQRADDLFRKLLWMTTQRASRMGYGVCALQHKLLDSAQRAGMAQRWSELVPEVWYLATVRADAYIGLRGLCPPGATREEQRLLRVHIDEEAAWLRAHWVDCGSFLAGNARAVTQAIAMHHKMPAERRSYLSMTVSSMKLLILLIAIARYETMLDDPATMSFWERQTAEKMPDGQWPPGLSVARLAPDAVSADADEHALVDAFGNLFCSPASPPGQ